MGDGEVRGYRVPAATPDEVDYQLFSEVDGHWRRTDGIAQWLNGDWSVTMARTVVIAEPEGGFTPWTAN